MEDRPPESPRVAFDYIKANLFRVVHADGIVGSVTPSGGVHLAFFSERAPIPKREVRAITPAGAIGDFIPEGSEMRNAVIREVDVGVMMSLDVAEALVGWLNQRIDESKNRNLTVPRDDEKQP